MYLTKERDAEIKIIDFGLAGDVSRAPYTCKTPCGTAHYAAPEVLSSLEYDQSADMWSLGVIIYTLLCGFPPFFDAANNMKNLYHLIKKGQYSFPSPFWDDISPDAKDLIRTLLVKDKDAGSSHPGPDAHRNNASRVSAPGHLVQQRSGHADARATEGVTESNGAAVHVDLVPVKAELVYAVRRLGCEGLVDFPEVDVVQRDSLVLAGSGNGGRGSDSHDFGIHA